MDYVLSCCSTVDLTTQRLKERNIQWANFHYFINDKEYLDDMFSSSMTASDFYQQVSQGAITKTSQINAEEYFNYFEKFLKEGKDVVHACLSSGLSGSYNSAKIAVEQLKEKYPSQTVYLIDSLCASSGYGLFVEELADMRDKGKTAQEVYNYGESIKLNVHLDFYSTDLSTYIRGGRISKTAGIFGSILKICPVLDMDNEGKLIVRKKALGKIKAAEELVNNMITKGKNGIDYNGRCYICHSNFLSEANRLASLLEERFDYLKGKIEIFSIGPTIGSHSGEGTVALFYLGSKREN